MTIPIATSPGRSGFGPQLSLSYDSGAGNGPFGLGWNLSLPSITRKTDKGLPRYRDAEESDVFILSGAEDLVPTLVEQSTGWIEEPVPNRTLGPDRYRIKRYRPRTEGLFARIERWSHLTQPNEVFWRSISKDNISTWYGRTAASRIADPADPARIFSWLICETRDDKGNAIIYDYAAEDDRHVDSTQAHEAHRQAVPGSRSANRYLKRICYGNRTSHLLDPGLANPQWMFQVVFDYGEGHLLESPPDPAGNVFAAATTTGTMAWPGRADPFSTYRAGFEVRTYRLCQRVLMFHHFAELAAESGPDGCLVRSTEFRHRAGPVATYLDAVTHSGYAWDQVAGKYLKRSLPPVAFTYSAVPTPVELAAMPVCELDRASLENLPVGLDGGSYQWIDLDGEGISGVLTQQAGAWYYKANLGAGRLGALQPVATLPATAAHGTGHQLLDLAGDGQLDVVNLSGPTPGFFERTPDERWENFKAFRQLPHLDWHDPNLRFIDLDGDGHAEILITEHDVFTWYPSLAEEGFAPARQVHLPTDEAQGPRLVFADGTQSMLLADMSGDGLTDLVRIRNGEICYWPNLGYGQFGPKVTMDHAPWFDSPDVFDHRRIRTADIDGSGVTDLLYLAADGIRLYYNQAGNRWSAPQLLPQFPPPDNLTTVNTVDLFGTGTACLVWSSPLPAHGSRPLCYIDLMGGQKPHLLIQTANNLGAKTKVHYSSSTKFYLQDKAAGKPWITRLSFPVHVVEKVETCDLISGNRFTTRYAYHHGYFDGTEREFRGFGLVEQWDTEEFTTLTGGGPPSAATNLDHSSHVPPVLTRTWFHTGIYLGRERVSDYFAGRSGSADRGEYYREPGWLDDPVEAQKHLLPDTVLPAGLSLDEEREACRALRGAMLRQEIYALDGPGSADYPYGHPYTVTEQNFTVRRVQPHQDNRYAVFFTHPCEALSIQYERNPTDPRTSHALTLAVDAFGNVLKSLAVGYGRRAGPTDPILTPTDKLKQSRRLIILTENRFTNGVADLDAHRTPLPAESRTFELTGFAPAGGALRFRFDEWTLNNFALSAAAAEIRYEQTAHHTSPQRRLIEHIRSLYRKNDLTTLLPTGVLESLALTGESYQLAFTPELLTVVYQRNGQPLLPTNPGDILQGTGGDRGGYILSAGSWWRQSGRGYFDPAANHANAAQTAAQELATARQGFFLPRKITDPFGQSTTVVFDTHHLFPIRTSDALGNTATAAYSYRTLQPELITDPNGNRTAAAFDALGLVVATAVLGRAAPAPVEGDLLAGFEANPTLAQLQSFLANPAAQSAALLGSATTRIVYDLERFRRCGQSPFAATLARETHGSDLDLGAGQKTKIQFSFSYSDGFGREIQKKIQAEPGDAPKRTAPRNEPSGDIAPGTLVLVNNQPDPAPADPRWVGTGRTVFNNKGQPVRQYEPFFSATHLYEPERELTDTGVSPILFYDPVGRVVATLNPNHTYGKVVFDPWKQTTHDVNDTVTLNPAADPDVAGFFRHRDGTPRIPTTDYTPTWYAERLALPAGDPERVAAEKAAAHANTPSVAHLDALGRPILTVAHNKVACPNHTLDGRVDKFCTRVELDIEGNQRAVLDAQDRIVMRYDYDLLGHRIHQASMEAGERWMLNDVTGKPIRAWNSRGHTFR